MAEEKVDGSAGSPDVPAKRFQIPEIDNGIACGIVGFSLYWAWFYLTCFSDIVILPTPVELHIEPLFRCCAFLATAIVLFVVLCCRRWMLRHMGNAVLVLAPVALSFALYLVTNSVRSFSDLNLPIEILVWVLFGAAYALVSIQSGFFFASINEKDSLLYIGISATVGGLVYVAIDAFSSQQALFATMLLPLFSTLAFWGFRLCSRKDVEEQQGQEAGQEAGQERQSVFQWLKDSWEIMPFQLLFGVVFGFAIGVAISLGMDDYGHFSWVIIIAFSTPGLVLILLFFRPSRSILQYTSRWILPLMTIILLPLPFVGYTMRIVCCGILVFGFVWYDLVHLNAVAGLMRAQKDSSLAIFCSRRVFNMFGIFVGHTFSWLLLVSSGFAGQEFSIAVIAIASVMILIISFLGTQKEDGAETVFVDKCPSGRDLEEVCDEICEEARLSPRQREVFFYLARGRNAGFIENTLVISNHTVKAHIYRIYQKLDIHSQQELIDLVEERASAKT